MTDKEFSAFVLLKFQERSVVGMDPDILKDGIYLHFYRIVQLALTDAEEFRKLADQVRTQDHRG